MLIYIFRLYNESLEIALERKFFRKFSRKLPKRLYPDIVATTSTRVSFYIKAVQFIERFLYRHPYLSRARESEILLRLYQRPIHAV